MAYEINDLKRTLILVFLAIPMIAARNINCGGRAFHCVNSTHFMICVDLGGGLSTTIDDFVIPCPATTVCHENNIFECDFPEIEVATPSLQVIDIYKQSDTSEMTLVTNSVTVPKPTSEILSVFKENITATTVPTPEAVTPVLKFEVLEDIKNDIRGNSDNTTDSYIQINSSLINTTNKIINDKDTNNKTITTSVTDKNKNLEPIVETSIHKPANTSLTDITKSIDTVTSVIGLINLISIDHPIAVSTKPSSNVLTSLDILNDNIATTTEQYRTKKVIIQGAKMENVTDTVIIGERSVIADEISTTPEVNQFIKKDINNSVEYNNNETITKTNSIDKSNSTTEQMSETTTEYLASIKIDKIPESVTVVASPQTTAEKTFNSVSVDSHNEMVSTKSPSDYLNKLNDNIVASIDQHVDIQKTILSDIPATTDVINTTTIFNIQINKTATNNDIFTELNSTVETTTTGKVPERKTNYFTPDEPKTASLQTTTEKTLVPISKETNIMYTTETITTSEDIFKNYPYVEKHTNATQQLEIMTSTDTSINIADNLNQFNHELNGTIGLTNNNTADTMNITKSFKTIDNYSSKDIINDKSIDYTLLQPTTTTINEVKKYPEIKFSSSTNDTYTNNKINDLSIDFINNIKDTEPTFLASTTLKYAAIEISPTGTTQNEFTARPIQATSELPTTNVPISVNELHIDNIGTNEVPHIHTTLNPYYGIPNTVTNNVASKSDIVTKQQIDFIPDSITFTEQATTQKIIIYSETKIPGSLNQPENLETTSLQNFLNTDQWVTTNALQNEVSMTTTYINNIEYSTTTSFPIDFTENNSFSDINQSITSTPNVVNTQDVLPKIIQLLSNNYVAEFTSTTPKTVQATPINLDTKTPQQVSTNTPGLNNIYGVSTTDYKIETSTVLPPDTTITENITDMPLNILKQEQLIGQNMDTVNQSNTASTTTETISDLVPFAVTTAGYGVLYTKDTDSSTKLLGNPVNTRSEVGTNVKNETVNPINSKNNATLASSADIIKAENIKIVSVFDIINSSVNGFPTKTMQQSNSYPSNKTTKSPDLTTYEPVTINIPEIINLEQVGESVTQKTPKAIVSSEETKVTNSVLVTPITQTIPIIEINTESIKHDGIEAPIPSTTVFEHMNPTKAAITSNYVTEKTNDYIMSTEVIKAIVSSEETKVTNSVLVTPITQTIPIIEINTKSIKHDGTEAPIPSTTVFEHMNPKKAAVTSNYVTEKTNNYIMSTEAILSQLNKLEAELYSNSVSSTTPGLAASPDSWAVPTNDKITSILDSAFKMNAAQVKTKVVADDNKKIRTESSFTKVIKAETPKYNTEPSLSLSKISDEQVVVTTEPTQSTDGFAQTTPLVASGETNKNVMPKIKTTDLPQNVFSIVNNNIPAQLSAKVTARQTTYESIPTAITFAQTTPTIATIGKTNQDVLPGLKTTDLPQKELSIINNDIPKPMLAQHMSGVIVAEVTSNNIATINKMDPTTPSLAAISKANLDVLPEIKTTDFSQNVSTVVDDNIDQLRPAQLIAGVTDAEITFESFPTVITYVQTTPSIATIGMSTQEEKPVPKTADLPQTVLSIVNNNIPKPMLAQHKTGVAVAQITFETIPTTNTLPETTTSLVAISKESSDVASVIKTTGLTQNVFSVVNDVNIPQAKGIPAVQTSSESTSTTNTLAQTTPSLATVYKIKKDILPEIKTTDLPQYGTTTGKNNNVQLISETTTKFVIDSLTVPDFIVETIKVVGDQVGGTHLGDSISSDVISNNPKVHSNYSVKSGNHIIDHESIVIGNTSENNVQNTTTTTSAIINKAEIVNHTESNWMSPDVNIDGVQLKEESIEEPETSTSLVSLDSSMNLSMKTSDIIDPKVIGVTPVPINLTGTGLDSPSNYTQSKPVIIKENKKLDNDTSVNKNTETFDAKNYEVQADSQKSTISSTKPSITTTYYNLSLHNSTINDELEQHLLSTNHTITAQIQSHLNESDKQSNKTSDELSLNVTNMHKPNLATTKLNASSENKTGIAVSTSVYNCSNHTRGKYADKNDCRKFYTCIGNLQPILGICPNNTVFSEINKQCTKNLSHCVRNNQFRCLLEGRFSDFFKDKIYYICVKNRIHGFIRYKLQCQDNYHLNKASVKCEKNEELSTLSASSVSETADESKPESKSAKIVASDNFECKKEGTFPYDKDCSKYYICTKIKNVYRRKIKKCASDEVFDKKKKKCVESDSGEC